MTILRHQRAQQRRLTPVIRPPNRPTAQQLHKTRYTTMANLCLPCPCVLVFNLSPLILINTLAVRLTRWCCAKQLPKNCNTPPLCCPTHWAWWCLTAGDRCVFNKLYAMKSANKLLPNTLKPMRCGLKRDWTNLSPTPIATICVHRI